MGRHLRWLVRSTWVPVTISVVLLVAVLVAVPWYYRTYRGAEPERGLSPVELEWAASYAPWRTRVGSTLALAYRQRTSVDGELGRILDRIRGCGDQLLELAGTPPSERLDPVLERAVAACAASDAALAEYRKADDTPSWRTSAALAGANEAIRVAEVELRRLLLAARPLPRRRGRTTESRIEPRLSDAVSVDQPTEVVCWSEDEWPQVRAELAVIGLERDRVLHRVVNAYRFHVHASPTLCEQLLRLTDPSRTASREPASAGTAGALAALLHAAQHAIGVEDEGEARCAAARLLRRTAIRLGAERESARLLEQHGRQASACP